LFLLPLWKQLGKAQWVLQARTLPKTIAISVAVVGLIAWLCLWPADFYLMGEGTLQPATRREVFASVEGVVFDVPVEHGQMVKKGQVVAQMRSTEIEQKITQTTGERATALEQILSAQKSLLENKGLTTQEKNRLSGELRQYEETYKSLGEQLELYNQMRDDLTVKSPIDGQIITWQVRESIIHRPVQRGQILMAVADPAGRWETEINMPENRMGHVAAELRRREAEVRAGKLSKQDEAIPIQFKMKSSSSNETYEGRVEKIEERAEVRGEDGNTVQIRASFDKQKLIDDGNQLRVGAGVRTKVYCGRAPIGYVWLHEVIAFVHTKILFPLF
jgi:multidrug efflux pump subunit AcrA (membrane-fusion protein)